MVSYDYDSCNRLTGETVKNAEGETIVSYSYTYNENGQKETATEEADGRKIQSEYGYDPLNRLTKEVTRITEGEGDVKTESTAYTYDAVGNRTKKLKDGTVYRYEYNSLNQLTKETGPEGETVYEYDGDGNLILKETPDTSENYTYSADGKLLSYKSVTGSVVTEEVYTYDGEGNRLSKETKKAGEDKKVYYVMDNLTGYSRTVLELDEEKQIKTVYTRGDGLLSIRTGSETRTYISDGHGDVRYLTDEEGKITDAYRYSAYGELIEKTGTTENPYLYCGEYNDEGTGLYYLRARYMNPSTGTFISMDSYRGNTYDPASLHKYTYAQNNPQMYHDPSGHFVALLGCMSSISTNSIMNNIHNLHIIGLFSGFMNAAVSQVFDTGDDMMTAFIRGYMAGYGIGMAYIGAVAITAFLEVEVLFHLGVFSYMYFEWAKNVALAVSCYAVGANKEGIVYSVLAVLCFTGMCVEYGLAGSILVSGKKGTVNIEVNAKRTVDESGINSINSLDDLLTNPNKLSGVSGEELYNYLVKNGYDVKPLNRGSFKGIPFEEGGGFKVNWGGDRILQYHPENLSHHGGAYFKISSGETGTIRIDLDGNLIN